MKTKQELFNYIESQTNWRVKEEELKLNFPLYIKSTYDIFNASIEGTNVLFAKVKDTLTDMRLHYNAIKKIQELCDCHVVIVFEKLKVHTINNMVSKQVPFIIEGGQIYMPFALMHIKNEKHTSPLKKNQKLSPNADLILIGYLDNQIHSGMMIKDIAKLINTELRATSTALKILESLDYLYMQKDGISKKAYFIAQQEVYEKLRTDALSPKKYFFFTKDKLTVKTIQSGYSALGYYSNLMDDTIKTVAIYEKNPELSQLQVTTCELEDADYKVEVWDREPAMFSKEGHVHPLYVLRLLKHSNDERTMDALTNLEINIINNLKGEA